MELMMPSAAYKDEPQLLAPKPEPDMSDTSYREEEKAMVAIIQAGGDVPTNNVLEAQEDRKPLEIAHPNGDDNSGKTQPRKYRLIAPKLDPNVNSAFFAGISGISNQDEIDLAKYRDISTHKPEIEEEGLGMYSRTTAAMYYPQQPQQCNGYGTLGASRDQYKGYGTQMSGVAQPQGSCPNSHQYGSHGVNGIHPANHVAFANINPGYAQWLSIKSFSRSRYVPAAVSGNLNPNRAQVVRGWEDHPLSIKTNFTTPAIGNNPAVHLSFVHATPATWTTVSQRPTTNFTTVKKEPDR